MHVRQTPIDDGDDERVRLIGSYRQPLESGRAIGRQFGFHL